MKKLFNLLTAVIILSIFLMLPLQISAQPVEQTVGLILNDSAAFDGYLLLAPSVFPRSYLVNNKGQYVHSWDHPKVPRHTSYLLEDGSLLRVTIDGVECVMDGGGAGGRGGCESGRSRAGRPDRLRGPSGRWRPGPTRKPTNGGSADVDRRFGRPSSVSSVVPHAVCIFSEPRP